MAKYPAIVDVSKIQDAPTRQALIPIKQNLELLTGRIDVGTRAVTQEDLLTLGLVVRAPNGRLQIPVTSTASARQQPTSTRFLAAGRGVQVAPQNLSVRQLVGNSALAIWDESGYPDYDFSQLYASNTQDSETAVIVADNLVGNAIISLPDSIDSDSDVWFWIRNVSTKGYPAPFDSGQTVGTIWIASTLSNPLVFGKFWDGAGGLIITNPSGLTPIPLDNNSINSPNFSHTPGDAFVTILNDGWYRLEGKVMFEEVGYTFGFHQFRATLQVDTGGGFVDYPQGFSLSGGRNRVSDTLDLSLRDQFSAGDKIQMALEVITLPGRAVTVADGSVMKIKRLA